MRSVGRDGAGRGRAPRRPRAAHAVALACLVFVALAAPAPAAAAPHWPAGTPMRVSVQGAGGEVTLREGLFLVPGDTLLLRGTGAAAAETLRVAVADVVRAEVAEPAARRGPSPRTAAAVGAVVGFAGGFAALLAKDSSESRGGLAIVGASALGGGLVAALLTSRHRGPARPPVWREVPAIWLTQR